jgi:hypothetical protein
MAIVKLTLLVSDPAITTPKAHNNRSGDVTPASTRWQ